MFGRTTPALFVAVATVFSLLSASAGSGEPYVAADEAYRQSRAGDVLIVDVRSPIEWRQTGVPEGATTVTIHQPDGEAGFIAAMLDAVGGDRSQDIAVICAAGVRSHRAQQWLQSNGFGNVSDISEGMLGRESAPGWLERGLPVESCAEC